MRSDRFLSDIAHAKLLAESQDTAPIKLAEALWRAEKAEKGVVKQIVAHKSSGAKHLGIRRAYYLLKVWDRFAPLKVPETRLAKVGWTKLALIATYGMPGKELRNLGAAEKLSAPDLKTYLQGGTKEPSKFHTVTLRLTPEQYEIFHERLVEWGAIVVKKGKGLTDKEDALINALIHGPVPNFTKPDPQ